MAGKEEKRNSLKVLVENPEGKKNLENLGVDGRLTLIFILKKKEGMTSPRQEQWLNVVNMVMNLWVPYNTGYFLTN